MLINKLSLLRIIFFGCLVIFCLLLFKDVFSQRTLIPNFEPFPDTFHYVVPARNFVLGNGFSISREERILSSHVSPLYSIYLIPFYLINIDARMFYFANTLLSLVGFVVFYRILKQIDLDPWIIGMSLFIFATNFYIYWFPSLAMAENLLVLIFICSIYLLLLPVNNKNIFLAIIVAISFYLTKYASAPLTATYLIIYTVKIYYFNKSKKYLFFYLILGSLFLVFSGSYLFFIKHMNPLEALVGYLSIFSVPNTANVFSVKNTPLNLPLYINAMVGNQTKVLWDTTSMLPKFIAILGLFGLILGSLKSNIKFVCLSLLCLLIVSVLFMSTFYSFDGRYIIFCIPTLILGFNIFLVLIRNFLIFERRKKVFYVFLLLFFIGYLLLNILRFKNQIMLNIKYAETPWYYISVLEMNKYFTSDKIENSKKPVVISAVAPFLIDFFSNKNYSLLPLSYGQEFRGEKETIWGPNDYSDLIRLYKEYINKGYTVYVARYGLGNEVETNRDYKIIEKNFNLMKVQTGCFEQCNIYKLTLKDGN